MFWTERMTQVSEIDADAIAAEGKRQSLRKVGAQLGITGQTVRIFRHKIERWNKFPHQADAHVQLWKKLLKDAAKVIEKAARAKSWQNQKAAWRRTPAGRLNAARKKARDEEDARERLKWQEWARQQDAMFRAAAVKQAKIEAEWQARRQAFIDQLAAQLASDPKLRELDQLMRQKVRQQERKP